MFYTYYELSCRNVEMYNSSDPDCKSSLLYHSWRTKWWPEISVKILFESSSSLKFVVFCKLSSDTSRSSYITKLETKFASFIKSLKSWRQSRMYMWNYHRCFVLSSHDLFILYYLYNIRFDRTWPFKGMSTRNNLLELMYAVIK